MEKNYEYPFIKKAVELLDESNYTEGQLIAYDNYLASIMSWNSTMKHQFDEGIAKGKEEGLQLTLSIIRDLKANISIEEIAAKYQVEETLVLTLRDSLLD